MIKNMLKKTFAALTFGIFAALALPAFAASAAPIPGTMPEPAPMCAEFGESCAVTSCCAGKMCVENICIYS